MVNKFRKGIGLITGLYIATLIILMLALHRNIIDDKVNKMMRFPNIDSMIDMMIEEGQYSDKVRHLLHDSVSNDLVLVQYNPNSPYILYMDGNGEYTDSEGHHVYRFGASYEYVESKWKIFDWSWSDEVN